MEAQTTIIPPPQAGHSFPEAKAEIELCFTCGTCMAACPVFMGTGLLSPMRLLRLAAYGQVDELIHSPEIWYCLRCNACRNACPMTVKPVVLIEYLRSMAIKSKVVSHEFSEAYQVVCQKLQQARWRLASECLKHKEVSVRDIEWETWSEEPIPASHALLHLSSNRKVPGRSKKNPSAPCFTCKECSGLCPVFFSRDVFDPVVLFRKYNYDLMDELTSSPAIWLCYACRRCTWVCPQQVRGHEIIGWIQEIAQSGGGVDKQFATRWRDGQQALFRFFVRDVNRLCETNFLN